MAQIPDEILKAAATRSTCIPKSGETVALVRKAESWRRERVRYARRLPPRAACGYRILWVDAVGTAHDATDDDSDEEEVQPVVWWKHTATDAYNGGDDGKRIPDCRVCGPAGEVFPRPEGWLQVKKRCR